MSTLWLCFLGPFQASLDDRPLKKFRTNKVQALLVYLAVEAPLAHRRDALMALLWPGLPQKSAQVNLRQTLYQLRRALPEVTARDGGETVPLVLSDRQTAQVNPAADVQLDVARFVDLLGGDPTPAQLAKAVALYRGDFLCDFYLPDSSAFEDWAATKRAELQRQVLDALEELTTFHIERGDYDGAQTTAWRQLEIDNLREVAYRGLMTALALDGQRGAALAQYQLCRKRLGRELGLEPTAETTALYERIQADALRESQERQPLPAPPQRGMPVFLFTDIQGSTPLWETHREAMLPALLAHNGILEEQIALHGGRILELRGDGVKAVFEGVDPLPCVLAIQKAFGGHDWGAVGEIRIRIGLHGTPPEKEGHEYFLKGDQYYGPALHHAARVMDAGHGGQILVSEQVRNAFPLPPGAAWRDFGRHQLRGVEESQAIFGLLHPNLLRHEFPPLRTLSAQAEPPEPSLQPEPTEVPRPRHNLPPQPTPFIGREEELAELDRLITDPDVRLVTVVGPGGMGKTRLALAAAERQLEATDYGAPRFPNGVYFVPLAAVGSPDQIVPTMAKALSFSFHEEREPRQQILDYLREKRLLLVMDNLEHLLDGAELLAEILQTAPDVQILVTSRERLHLHQEQVYPIHGLAYPDWETPADVPADADSTAYAAVQLFLQSAQRVQSHFELAADDLPHLTHVCRLVDGMPLGIELAAAWVDMLSLADIAAETQRSFDFLEADWRDVPERHRSIRAVLDASWQRLSPAERDVFPQLSVFRGGFSRQAAQEVAGAHLRALVALADKSLLRFDKARDRYEIHELLRQYGADRLAADPEEEAAVRHRHYAYYCAWLGQREAELKEARQQAALAEIEADIENAQVAWGWAVAQRQVVYIDQAMNGLCGFFELRNRFQDGEAASQLAATELSLEKLPREKLAATENQRVLAKALAWQGRFSQMLAPTEVANPLLAQSLELLESLALAGQEPVLSPSKDTRAIRALALRPIVHSGPQVGDPEELGRRFEQSLALYQALGDQWGVADALLGLGDVANRSEAYDQAKQRFEESLALYQALGNQWHVAHALNGLGGAGSGRL